MEDAVWYCFLITSALYFVVAIADFLSWLWFEERK